MCDGEADGAIGCDESLLAAWDGNVLFGKALVLGVEGRLGRKRRIK